MNEVIKVFCKGIFNERKYWWKGWDYSGNQFRVNGVVDLEPFLIWIKYLMTFYERMDFRDVGVQERRK